MLCFVSNDVSAQSNSPVKQEKVTPPIVTTTQKQELDTEESLEYMGTELLFQLKKRLHLTTEEEEKEKEEIRKKNKKKLTFNILGIKIERG